MALARTVVARCSCEATLRWLADHGGAHAQRMIAQGRTRTEAWGPEDWLPHMDEEEVLLFPRFPADVRRHLVIDHHRIRVLLHAGRKIPVHLARRHADLEDRWTERIIRQGSHVHGLRPTRPMNRPMSSRY